MDIHEQSVNTDQTLVQTELTRFVCLPTFDNLNTDYFFSRVLPILGLALQLKEMLPDGSMHPYAPFFVAGDLRRDKQT